MPEPKPVVNRTDSPKPKSADGKAPPAPARKPQPTDKTAHPAPRPTSAPRPPARPGQSAPRPAAPARPGQGAPRPAAPARPGHPAPSRPGQPAPSRPLAPSRPGHPAPARPGHPAPSRPGQPAPTRPLAPKPGQPGNAPRPMQSRPGQPAPVARPPIAPKPVAPPPPPPPPKPIELPENLTVRDLAAHLKVGPIDIIKKLMANGIMANINQPIDFDTAALIAGELGFEVIEPKPIIVEPEISTLTSIPKKREYTAAELAHLVTRPPVVTVMGHVDHGKTSLLDVIRNANVVAGEAGGITQHIGAYQVVHADKRITFLDTPGHEAFTAMRARGAKATDIAIIVVAADDGVMPQTREAIDHARAAQVPIIIALNKVDKANANPEFVKQQLSELGLQVYGGKDEVTVVALSAKQKTGIAELLDNVIVVAELADLRADPKKPATGVVIESKLDKQQGAMATLLIHEGTLQIGDAVLMGTVWGKVRAMFNDRGAPVKHARPGEPVVVTGLGDVPEAGETFAVIADERAARDRAAERLLVKRQAEQKTGRAVSLNDLYVQFQAGNVKELDLIIKADVAGSLEPIVSSLEKLGYDKIKVKVIHQGIGTITRSDIMLAMASQGIVISFNVDIEPPAEALAEAESVDVRKYSIIYKLIEDIDLALKGMLEPVYKDMLIGAANVIQLFRMKKQTAAGVRVQKGKIARNATARVLRGNTELFKGPLSSLKRFTDDVKEVGEGYECGVALEKFNDFQEGDTVEFYQKVKVS
ncbi:MAG: translation initiation factor IF-2 [Chloroflexi bacterium]|nr:translation initiation factor IF-2 [Chloroflexota bacterium]